VGYGRRPVQQKEPEVRSGTHVLVLAPEEPAFDFPFLSFSLLSCKMAGKEEEDLMDDSSPIPVILMGGLLCHVLSHDSCLTRAF
jgi:hypothetical protein